MTPKEIGEQMRAILAHQESACETLQKIAELSKSPNSAKQQTEILRSIQKRNKQIEDLVAHLIG